MKAVEAKDLKPCELVWVPGIRMIAPPMVNSTAMREVGYGWTLVSFYGRNLDNGRIVQCRSIYRKREGQFKRVMREYKTEKNLFTRYYTSSTALRLIVKKGDKA